jgi:hypothetical protein
MVIYIITTFYTVRWMFWKQHTNYFSHNLGLASLIPPLSGIHLPTRSPLPPSIRPIYIHFKLAAPLIEHSVDLTFDSAPNWLTRQLTNSIRGIASRMGIPLGLIRLKGKPTGETVSEGVHRVAIAPWIWIVCPYQIWSKWVAMFLIISSNIYEGTRLFLNFVL